MKTLLKVSVLALTLAFLTQTNLFADDTKKTLGVMQAGEYEFSTGAAEIMEILSGELEWQMKGESDWKKIVGGEAFNVPANSVFLMKVPVVTDYCCSFVV